jgi:hypothetical protein
VTCQLRDRPPPFIGGYTLRKNILDLTCRIAEGLLTLTVATQIMARLPEAFRLRTETQPTAAVIRVGHEPPRSQNPLICPASNGQAPHNRLLYSTPSLEQEEQQVPDKREPPMSDLSRLAKEFSRDCLSAYCIMVFR